MFQDDDKSKIEKWLLATFSHVFYEAFLTVRFCWVTFPKDKKQSELHLIVFIVGNID